MKQLSHFTTAFCTVCIVMGVLYMLCPKGALEKAVKYIFSLILLICVISALPGLKNITAELGNGSQSSEINDTMHETALRLTFETALRNNGIEFSKITVCTDKTEDGSIKITKVVVISSEPPDTVREVLGDENGAYTVEVHP